jgi:hypothetical protein
MSDKQLDEAISKASSSTVSLSYYHSVPFDTHTASVSHASGFIVDAKQGYILANRHVVQAIGFKGKATFSNKEVVEVTPAYRDNAHDFAFLKFNPKAIRLRICVDEHDVAQFVIMGFCAHSKEHGQDRVFTYGVAPPQDWSGSRPHRMLLDDIQVIFMDEGRILGVRGSWINRITSLEGSMHWVFQTSKHFAGNQCDLKDGDILLDLDGQLVTKIPNLDATHWKPSMAATINRDGQEQKLEVETIFAADTETIRVITWSGINLHAPHLAVCQRVKEILSRVYIASVLSRPPAQLYGLPHGCFIPEANNVPTLDLSVFKSVIQNGRPGVS